MVLPQRIVAREVYKNPVMGKRRTFEVRLPPKNTAPFATTTSGSGGGGGAGGSGTNMRTDFRVSGGGGWFAGRSKTKERDAAARSEVGRVLR